MIVGERRNLATSSSRCWAAKARDHLDLIRHHFFLREKRLATVELYHPPFDALPPTAAACCDGLHNRIHCTQSDVKVVIPPYREGRQLRRSGL